MNNKYIPFLKLKVNEIGALKELAPSLKPVVTPFFDIAKKKSMSPEGLADVISRGAKSVQKNLSQFPEFYLDSYDIDDYLFINGDHNYLHVVQEFKNTNFIPIVGLDRTPRRNAIVFEAKKSGLIKSSRIAIRLQSDDFESYKVVEQEIKDLFKAGAAFTKWDLIFDNRVCINIDAMARAAKIVNFISEVASKLAIDRYIVSGSSIPASIGEILATEADLAHPRTELTIYRAVKAATGSQPVLFGDYTIVSPLYSDLDIPAAALRNVITAKIAYTHGNVHYICRGGALRSHARGELQYNDIARAIIGSHFYRGAPYSFGDNFLDEKANFIGASVTASSILKPTINLHITYMLSGAVI
jgi:hypothetical protein